MAHPIPPIPKKIGINIDLPPIFDASERRIPFTILMLSIL